MAQKNIDTSKLVDLDGGDVFGKPIKRKGKKQNRRGRPKTINEKWKRYTIPLLVRHAAFLDGIRQSIHKKHGQSIERAKVIRAIFEAMQKSGIDLAQAKTPEEIESILIKKLKK